MTYMERLGQVEEELFIVQREHAASLTQLANQQEQIESLTIIVEELRRVVASSSPMSSEIGPQKSPSFPISPLQVTTFDRHLA